MVDDQDSCEWVNVFFFWYQLACVVPDKGPLSSFISSSSFE